MFRSIVFLIAGNVVSRAFYTVAMLVLAETYSPDIFSEIIFTATVLLFLGTVGPLRFELAILEDNVNDKTLASYLIYAVAACMIVFIMLIYFDKKNISNPNIYVTLCQYWDGIDDFKRAENSYFFCYEQPLHLSAQFL